MADDVGELAKKLAARDKTIGALMARVERESDYGAAATYATIEQNIELHRAVEQKTMEIERQRAVLAGALDELKRTQAMVLQGQKLEAIGQLAAGIAHEINTPTQYVSDNAAFLQRAFTKLITVVDAAREVVERAGAGQVDEGSVARLDEALKKAKIDTLLRQVPRALEQSLEGLKRVAAIVSAMKDFSHPSAGERSPVDLHDAIRSTITVATNEWKYVADVETSFDPALPHVPCMRDEFNQVILNLIVNASHAIAAKMASGDGQRGTIKVTTRREGNEAVVLVEDTGCGIPERNRARVFDPFFTTKPVGKGTGQGLAIAYSVIVEKHGGTIDVQSIEGSGSTFVIRLPLEDRAKLGEGSAS